MELAFDKIVHSSSVTEFMPMQIMQCNVMWQNLSVVGRLSYYNGALHSQKSDTGSKNMG